MKKESIKKYGPIVLIGALLIISVLVIIVLRPKNTTTTATGTPSVLDKSITKLEGAIKINPEYVQNYIDLSDAYLQKARETADSSYYQKIDGLMNTAEKIDPQNADVSATRSSVAMGRHNFIDGQKYAKAALAKNNHNDIYYGLLGDADIELGQYTDAVGAFQKMINIRPGFSSYSRIAYIRELYGDIPGAKAALHLAIDSGSSFKENTAWAYVELGKLDMRTNLDDAKKDFNDALAVLPTHTQAMEGLGKVAFAQGDTDTAIGFFNQALQALPLAQYSTDLADVYGAKGDSTKRDQYVALTESAYASSVASGVDVDLEESLFLADHDIQLDKALQEAQQAYAVRPSQYAADYLAWAQYKNNNVAEAATYQKQAFVLGQFDPLILFHQGMIALKNNDMLHAKKYLQEAYAINPNFSIEYRAVLKDTLDSLK